MGARSLSRPRVYVDLPGRTVTVTTVLAIDTRSRDFTRHADRRDGSSVALWSLSVRSEMEARGSCADGDGRKAVEVPGPGFPRHFQAWMSCVVDVSRETSRSSSSPTVVLPRKAESCACRERVAAIQLSNRACGWQAIERRA